MILLGRNMRAVYEDVRLGQAFYGIQRMYRLENEFLMPKNFFGELLKVIFLYIDIILREKR